MPRFTSAAGSNHFARHPAPITRPCLAGIRIAPASDLVHSCTVCLRFHRVASVNWRQEQLHLIVFAAVSSPIRQLLSESWPAMNRQTNGSGVGWNAPLSRHPKIGRCQFPRQDLNPESGSTSAPVSAFRPARHDCGGWSGISQQGTSWSRISRCRAQLGVQKVCRENKEQQMESGRKVRAFPSCD